MSDDLCATCGHDRVFHRIGTGVFHRIGTGSGVPIGVEYCDDRHSDPCDCRGFKKRAPSVYIIGSLRNPRVPEVAVALRAIGWDAFDDWYSPGPDTDIHWQAYEKARGRTFKEALAGYHARHAFALDERHIERCDVGLLVLPAGKSAHIEFGVFRGMKKPRYILMDGEPEKYDLMYRFTTDVFMSVDEMLFAFRGLKDAL